MADAHEMHDLSHLNHLAVDAWVRDKRDSSCRAWTVKVILGLCIGVLAAAVVGLSIMLSTHCGAPSASGPAATTCPTATVTVLQGQDAVHVSGTTITKTQGPAATVTETLTSARSKTVTETKIRHSTSVSTRTISIASTCAPCSCFSPSSPPERTPTTVSGSHSTTASSSSSHAESRSSSGTTSSSAAASPRTTINCMDGLQCSQGSTGDLSGKQILSRHPDCEDILIASLAGTTDQSLVNSSNTQSQNLTAVSNCMFECRGDNVNVPGQVMFLACCTDGLNSEGTHCAKKES